MKAIRAWQDFFRFARGFVSARGGMSKLRGGVLSMLKISKNIRAKVFSKDIRMRDKARAHERSAQAGATNDFRAVGSLVLVY